MPAGRAVPTHFLRTNEREWTPACALFVDTETRTLVDGDNEILVLRCWVARRVDRRNLRKTEPDMVQRQGETRDQLADTVEELTTARKSMWVFCHNLAFDLTVTNLLDELVARGWVLGEKWSAHARAPWFRLSKAGRSLCLVDSVTWLPAPLGEVAPLVGKTKPADPPADDETGWLDRCRADVDILAAAMCELMDWWDRAGMGNWSVTGNTCGWNAMRHRLRKSRVLVRTGDGGREFERQALYSGRRDATRWGDVVGGPFVTVDFEDCYPTLAAHLRLPAKRLDRFTSLPVDSWQIGDGAIQVAARCVVATKVPFYPLRHAGAVWYPTGEFETVLAGPELAEARLRGDLRSVGEGYRYWCDGHLAGWARWVVDLAHGRVDGTPEVARLPGRRWGRSVLGRFAQRVGTASHWGPAETVGWGSQESWCVTNQVSGRLVDLAGERWLIRDDTEADDSFPAVFAWVESYTRVRLNRMLEAIGEDAWVSCNTDGALVDMSRVSLPYGRTRRGRLSPGGAVRLAATLCDEIAGQCWPLVPRPKSAHGSVWLSGPQQLVVDGERKLAGVGKGAVVGEGGRLEARVWPSIPWQMAHGDRRGFVRPLQSYTVPPVTVHRLAMADGSAVPLVAVRLEDGETQLLPGVTAWSNQAGPFLAPAQSKAVERLVARTGAGTTFPGAVSG